MGLRRLPPALLLSCFVVASACLAGCGSSPTAQQKTQTLTVTLSPSDPSVALGATQQFTATVAGAKNSGVTWAVNSTTGGAAATGTISATGLYTAPAKMPSPATVTVTATSAQDPTASASTTVTLTAAADVTVTVTPATVTLNPGQKQDFQAAVTGASNTAVNWSVNGTAGGSASVGTIDGNGHYIAPATVPSPAQVTVTATSQADAKASGSATVTVQAAQSALGLTPASTAVTVPQGGTATQTFQVATPAGFSGTIALTVAGLPANLTAGWDHAQLTAAGPATLTITSPSFSLAQAAVPVMVTATATDAGGATSTATATVDLAISGWTGQVRTLAGVAGGQGFEDGGSAVNALECFALTAGPSGTIYFLDKRGHAFRQLDLASGAVTTLVGGPYGYVLPYPSAVAWDPASQTIYATDTALEAVVSYHLGDASANTSFITGLNDPNGVAVSPDGGELYVADSADQTIRRFDLPGGGNGTIVAGVSGDNGNYDATGTHALLSWPWGLAMDPTGRYLYFGERYSNLIRRMDLTTGAVTTLAGSGGSGDQDGPAAQATFSLLGGMAVDPHDGGADLLYFTDKDKIRALTLGASPQVVTLAGTDHGGDQDGAPTEAGFNNPTDLTVVGDLAGPGSTSIFVGDTLNGTIRRVDVANPKAIAAGAGAGVGDVSTVAGQTPHTGLVDGAGTGPDYSGVSSALFDLPQGITTDGKVAYVADSANYAIRKIDLSSGQVTTVAGGHDGYEDGPAKDAAFYLPSGVQLDAAHNVLYIADTAQSMIRKLDLNSMTVSTLAGAPQAGYTDGAGTAARFNHPYGMALSADGEKLYIADVGNNAIRQMTCGSGDLWTCDAGAVALTTLAGGHHGSGSADGVGPAARFYDPTGLALSPDGSTIYITDFNNHLIRKLDLSTLAVTTIAGKPIGPNEEGTCGHQDGIGQAATLCSPAMLATDGRNLYWGDSLTGLLRAMNLASGQVTTVAGVPGVLRAADGDLTQGAGGITSTAQFTEPFGVAVAPDGSFLLITDTHASVVRILK